jgi:hypothetical protein
MTEAISFEANGCMESCKCDQEFWTYPQQNKGQVTNLIINQTMLKKTLMRSKSEMYGHRRPFW